MVGKVKFEARIRELVDNLPDLAVLVEPMLIRTDMTQRGRGAVYWPGTEERFAARAMMGRIGEPEDIANAVVFLASPESGWITAQVLTVDGGRMDYIGHG